MTAVLQRPAALPAGHYRFVDIVRSEWTKMWSVRSTVWTLLATAIVTIALSVVGAAQASSHWTSMSAASQAVFDPTSVSLQGVIYSQLVIGVLGILLITSEYATGTSMVTFAAVPARGKVLAAKTLVLVVVAGILGESLSFAAFFAGQMLLKAPAPHATLGQPGVLRAVVGGGAIFMILGLFALGLGMIIRHTAGAITAYVIALLVINTIVGALPPATQDTLGKVLPAQIAITMTTVTAPLDHPEFAPWTGLALLAIYAAVALAAGALLLRRRDV
jgi:ABC-type transport system involved in multi-copper enzyme maturation permease subunit